MAPFDDHDQPQSGTPTWPERIARYPTLFGRGRGPLRHAAGQSNKVVEVLSHRMRPGAHLAWTDPASRCMRRPSCSRRRQSAS